MLVFVYAADLYCEDCGAKIREELTAKGQAPEDPEDEWSYDSDDFPKGPTEETESDSPSHCGGCGVFLESPLTSEGEAYVIETVKRNRDGNGTPAPKFDRSVCIYSRPSEEWAAYYDYLDFSDPSAEDEDDDPTYDRGTLAEGLAK